MTPVEQKWYEDVSTFSPGALQVVLEAYEAQMATMATKIDYLRLLIALDSRPPDPLPKREKLTPPDIGLVGFRFDTQQWRDWQTRTPPDPETPTEGGSTWIAKSK